MIHWMPPHSKKVRAVLRLMDEFSLIILCEW
nr:MAG TPA: hypothetical protein [Caudoviricetes sp.]